MPSLAKKTPDEKYYCPECLEEVDKEAIKCPHCGADYQEGEEEAGFECMVCACEVAPDAKFCTRCGTVFLDEIENTDEVIKKIGEHDKRRKSMREMENDER